MVALLRLHLRLHYNRKETMAYSGRSTFYNIPIALNDDLLGESENIQQMQMIDDILEASTGVVGTGIISEGSFSIITDIGSGYKVLIEPLNGIAVHGLLGSGLASTKSQVSWEGMRDGNFYYLYLEFTSNLYKNSTSFNAIYRTTPVSSNNTNFLYMATLDLTGSSPILDSHPDGKVYARTFTQHIGTQFNPHTANLTQTNLTVTGSISANLDSNKSVYVNQENVLSSTPLVVLNHAAEGATIRATESGDIRVTESGDFRIIEGGGSSTSVPLISSTDEFGFQDLRMSTRVSSSGQTSFLNSRTSFVGAINQNFADNLLLRPAITGNTAAITGNAVNITSNTSNILQNIGNTATNSSNIEVNRLHINLNATDIFTNKNAISGNVANILINSANITGNTSAISGNIADINVNNSNIIAISGQVSTNTSDLLIHEIQLIDTRQRIEALERAVFSSSSSSSS